MTIENIESTTSVVGLGEIRVSREESEILACLGLGSCVAVCVYDHVIKAGGMAHVVLPDSRGRQGQESSPKYADVAVPMLLNHMRDLGAEDSRMVVKIAGGAQMSQALGMEGVFRIGETNIGAVMAALAEEGFVPLSVEVGGHHGRTLRLFVESGTTIVRGAGMEEREI